MAGAVGGGTSLPPDLALDLHHVAVVVADLEAGAGRYAALGFGGGERFVGPEQGVEVAVFRAVSGWVELISPTDPEGAIGRFLAKRG